MAKKQKFSFLIKFNYKPFKNIIFYGSKKIKNLNICQYFLEKKQKFIEFLIWNAYFYYQNTKEPVYFLAVRILTLKCFLKGDLGALNYFYNFIS